MDKHSQAFRSNLSLKIIHIPAKYDSSTNHYFIRWDDIKQCFENAKYILNGNEVVTFITGDDFEDLIPRRIGYHAGVVLEVVTDSKESQSVDTADEEQQRNTVDSYTRNFHSEVSTPPSRVDTGEIQSLPQQLSSLSIVADAVYIGATNNGLAAYSHERYPSENASLQGFENLFTSYFQAIMSGQVHQATGIKNAMDLHVQHLKVALNKNKALQEQVILMQQQMDAKQNQMLQLQKQAVVILSTIQNKIQS
ncbi:hypothetical protein BGZ58_004271, partial [Dissophora ornata]